MARICSFCKREVNNDVCCNYCGTPLIFSEDKKAENSSENKEQVENNIESINLSVDKISEEEKRIEIKSGIEALYNQSKHLRDNRIDSIFNEENGLDDKNLRDNADDIKINIYNSEIAEENDFSKGETRVISKEDIEAIKRAVDERKNANHASSETEDVKDEELSDDEENISDLSAENGADGEKDENIQDAIDYETSENDENNDTDEMPVYVRHTTTSDANFNVRKEVTKLTKFLKWVLGLMFLAGLVCLFFPALNPTDALDTLSFSIVDAVLLITTFAGMCFAFFEKNGIRKFIYGIMFSSVFFAVYIIFARPIPPKNMKELCTVLYLAIMLVVSVSGHISSGGTKLEKLQVWFDTFSYLALVADVFVISLVGMLWIFMPKEMSLSMQPYLISVGAICLFALIGIVLMMKRKIAGANMYLLSAIATIIVSMLAYNKIINTIGYYSSVISLMNVIGSGYAKFIALCVIYPIFMYSALVFINKKTEEA